MAVSSDSTTSAAGGGPGTGSTPASVPAPRAAPAVTLPKGGGALKGIGEKFAADPVTGAGALAVPVAATPGVRASEPSPSPAPH
ncbi:hypothetical protein [Streptomyces sp. NPDC004284]|uniref:hypothetical protein n=1 Tax=Streptomyces sp. NPDC004284 TaxID=3364695 RepID=UPI003697ED47